MKNHKSQNHHQYQSDLQDIKQIPKWTKRYAGHRTLPFTISCSLFILLFCAIICFGLLFRLSYKAGNFWLFWPATIALTATIIFVLVLSLSNLEKKIINSISNKLYKTEGSVTFTTPKIPAHKLWISRIGLIIFVLCVFTEVLLGILGLYPIKYMQPISALYVIPFFIFLGFFGEPIVACKTGAGYFTLLWPVLYLTHAILIVAGVPILFHRPWTFLNILIPVAGYGALCGIIGHIYSRYALHRLKKLTKIASDNVNAEPEVKQ